MRTENTPDAEYWQSVDEWLDSAQFRGMIENEFPEDAADWLDPVGRRQFLTLMGASVALAGAVGCNPSVKPASQRKVLPHVRQPDQMLPGIPLFFATSWPGPGGVSKGLIVKQQEGRPIKVEGNPNHPGSLGGTDLISQATVLSLYDPDRSRAVLKDGAQTGYDKFLEEVRGLLEAQKAKQGAGLRLLTEPTTSPTLTAQVEEVLKRFPRAKWVQYEPVNRDSCRRAVNAAFGKPVNPVYRLEKAQVVLSLDCDFLSAAGPGDVRYSREFMANRKVREVKDSIRRGEGVALESMNRLYAVESMLTSTGGVADHRLPLQPSKIEDFARGLAATLGVPNIAMPALSTAAAEWLKAVADDLQAHRGKAVVLAGDTQPPAVHLIALAINERLGAFGQTVQFTDPLEPRPADTGAEFAALAQEITDNKVDLLLMLNVNPVYDAPADLNFGTRLAQMKGAKVHVGLYADETAVDGRANWHVNAAHYLECWGDARAYDGTVAIQQPLIAPLHGGKSAHDIFALLLEQGANDPGDLVRATWRKFYDEKVKPGAAGEPRVRDSEFQAWWDKVLRDGVVPNTALPAVTVTAVNLDKLNDKAFATPAPKGGLEIQFRPDLTLWDGRHANNGWLQELPRPVTTLTWDNAAILSPGTAEKYGLKTGFDMRGGERGHTLADVVNLSLAGRILRLPVFILPGHADDAITLHLGYGRGSPAGRVGQNKGFNANLLRTTTALWTLGGVELAKAPDPQYPLACVQGQYLMEGRRPARHATVEQFKADREFAQIPPSSAAEYKELRALTPGTPEDLHRLGMDSPYGHVAGHHDAHKPAAGEPKDDKAHAHGSETAAGHDPRIIPLSLYPEYPQPVRGQEANKTYRRWGMVIDLGACTGCSACVAACVSENNIPVVGKDQVLRGRAMHWIRVDRYFSIPGEKTQEDDLGGRPPQSNAETRAVAVKLSGRIRTHFQPLMCVQCEKAPCEVVCPVGATVHSADGLNDMVYNRCVGTRYCSNNCPYKVRRFNFLQYTDYSSDSLKLANNPEVTVRTRGVMEKCTYCVQRIRNGEMEAEREHAQRKAAGKFDEKNQRPRIVDGEIVTACQAACPTVAITFGDINDPESAVLRGKAEPHGYGLLAEQNTSPRTSYLAAIRNPNPAVAAATNAKGGA